MYEDGLCEISPGLYSISFLMNDINYQIARREDQVHVFTKWCEFLNSFDSTVRIQVSVRNKFISSENMKKQITISDYADGLDDLRHEFNEMLMSKAVQGQNGIQREKYLTLSFHSPSFAQATATANRLQSEVVQGLKKIDCGCIYLSGEARVKVLSSYFGTDTCPWSYRELLGSGLRTKDFIVPDSFDFRGDKSFSFISGWKKQFATTLYLRNYPPNMGDRLLTDLADIACNLTIAQHICPVEPDKALDTVKNQLAKMDIEVANRTQKAMREGYLAAVIPFELQHRIDEAKELLDDLMNKNQRMFRSTIMVYTTADSKEELENNVELILQTARRANCAFGCLVEQQEAGLNSILPIGKNHFSIERTLNTASTAITIPFSSQELFDPSGIYYGQNVLSQQLIMFNRTTLLNPSGFILGVPGSGKSFKAKEEIEFVLMTHPDDDVIIIDPEREFTPLAAGFDGEVIHISSGSQAHLNPMDITENYSDDESPLNLKTEFILSMCEMLIGGREGLGGDERTLIDRAVRISYERFFARGAKKDEMPTLKDFYEILKTQPEPQAQSLALSLEIYTEGGLSTFAHKTNVQTTKRLVVYDTRDLGKQLKALGLLIVLDQIWNRITSNKANGKRTWIYVDEFYLLFQEQTSANYFEQLYKRARKWGAIPTGITQNVTDLLQSDTACTMLSNSEFILLLNQSPVDRASLVNILGISERQLQYVTNAEAGSGLMVAGKAIVPFVDSFPKDTQLYRMMTTKFDEVREMAREGDNP